MRVSLSKNCGLCPSGAKTVLAVINFGTGVFGDAEFLQDEASARAAAVAALATVDLDTLAWGTFYQLIQDGGRSFVRVVSQPFGATASAQNLISTSGGADHHTVFYQKFATRVVGSFCLNQHEYTFSYPTLGRGQNYNGPLVCADREIKCDGSLIGEAISGMSIAPDGTIHMEPPEFSGEREIIFPCTCAP